VPADKKILIRKILDMKWMIFEKSVISEYKGAYSNSEISEIKCLQTKN